MATDYREKYSKMTRDQVISDLQVRASTLSGKNVQNNVQNIKLQKDIFISYFERIGNVQISCDAVLIKRRTYNNWLKEDPEFAERIDNAKEIFNDYLRHELVNRSIKGTFVPKLHRGDLITVPAEGLPADITDNLPKTDDGQVIIGDYNKSERLFELLLKSRLPEFKDVDFGKDNKIPDIKIEIVNPNENVRDDNIIEHENKIEEKQYP